MTLQIEFPSEIEQALEAKAARLGVPVEHYAAGVLRRDVKSNGDTRTSIAARLEALGKLQELAASFNHGKAPLPDAAISRDSIYADEGITAIDPASVAT